MSNLKPPDDDNKGSGSEVGDLGVKEFQHPFITVTSPETCAVFTIILVEAGVAYPKKSIDESLSGAKRIIWGGVLPEFCLRYKEYDGSSQLEIGPHPEPSDCVIASKNPEMRAHCSELLYKGVQLVNADIIVTEAYERDVAGPAPDLHLIDDFRRLVLATKMAKLTEPHVVVCESESLSPISSGLEYHTLQEYLQRPELRESRWKQLVEDRHAVDVLRKYTDIRNSMLTTNIRVKERKTLLLGSHHNLIIDVASDISGLDYAKKLVERVERQKKSRM
ncbi:MAG: hypothetical protein V1744_01190 [Candidatus Altiarchaeota archaeon]